MSSLAIHQQLWRQPSSQASIPLVLLVPLVVIPIPGKPKKEGDPEPQRILSEVFLSQWLDGKPFKFGHEDNHSMSETAKPPMKRSSTKLVQCLLQFTHRSIKIRLSASLMSGISCHLRYGWSQNGQTEGFHLKMDRKSETCRLTIDDYRRYCTSKACRKEISCSKCRDQIPARYKAHIREQLRPVKSFFMSNRTKTLLPWKPHTWTRGIQSFIRDKACQTIRYTYVSIEVIQMFVRDGRHQLMSSISSFESLQTSKQPRRYHGGHLAYNLGFLT